MPRPAFGHGAETLLTDAAGDRQVHLVGGYHPSRRDMSPRTPPPGMLHDVLHRSTVITGLPLERQPPQAGTPP
ncbi:hypothetical protein [Streptomyces incanus]|uniref:Uncharacterized protein n=1 Tax=Streptomyces incanus TaxID=887453 RepID=A0ABW0XVK3_9ACTN